MFQILPGPCEKAVGETEWKPLEELEETGLSEIRGMLPLALAPPSVSISL